MSRIDTLSENNLHQVVAEAARRLMAGEIIIFPTDTVYGLMLHSTDGSDLARLNAVKKRAPDKPVAALLAPDSKLIQHMRDLLVPLAGSRAPELVPGALTIVADRETWAGRLPPSLLRLPYELVGVRIPSHPALLQLLSLCEGWALATSANLEGSATRRSLLDVLAQLSADEAITLAVDGGECGDKPSAVVQIAADEARILRGYLLPEQ